MRFKFERPPRFVIGMSCYSNSKGVRLNDTLATNQMQESLGFGRKESQVQRSTAVGSQASSQLRLALKRQLIELREDKSNYDYLFAKLNGLQHKLRLLEEELTKNTQSFGQRQEVSERQIMGSVGELANLKKRIEAKEREFAELRESYERLVLQAHGFEGRIKENLELRSSTESKALREREEYEEVLRRKGETDEECALLRRKCEQVEEELEELENQLRYYRALETDVGEKTDALMLEIRASENKKEALDLSFERLSDSFGVKSAERGELLGKLEAGERAFDQLCASNKAEEDRIRKLQKAHLEGEKRLAEAEVKLMCVEKLKADVSRERNERDGEIIEQAKKLKQMDYELETLDLEVRRGEEGVAGLLGFHEKLLRCLAAFEEQNAAVLRMVSNTGELKEAISGLTAKIEDAKKCLTEI